MAVTRLIAPSLSATALGIAMLFCQVAQAQSLRELYDAARAYDAAYQAAQALAKSADYRVAAAEGVARPQAALSSGASTARVDPRIHSGDDQHYARIGGGNEVCTHDSWSESSRSSSEAADGLGDSSTRR